MTAPTMDMPSMFEDAPGTPSLEYVPPDDATPEAPFGINPNTGKPYRLSPAEREERGKLLAAGRAAARARGGLKSTPPPRKASTRGTSTPKKASAPADYTAGIAGLMQIPTAAVAMLGRFAPVFTLDAIALSLATPPIAQAVNDLALDHPAVAAWVERMVQVGPYGALFGAVVPLVMQLAANHGVLAPNPDFGILDKGGLLAAAGITADDPTT